MTRQNAYTADVDTRTSNAGVTLLRDLVWLEDHAKPQGRKVTVSTGFTCDGASVPRAFWFFVRPLEVNVAKAAMLHDWAYWKKQWDNGHHMDRQTADYIFREAMRITHAKKIEYYRQQGRTRLVKVLIVLQFLQRWAAWAAVRAFGWLAWRHEWQIPRINQDIRAEVYGVLQDLTSSRE